jgi:3-mercaptopyruvate sulfurtransferase SseA
MLCLSTTFALTALVSLACAAQAVRETPANPVVVSTSWLAERLDDPSVVVLYDGSFEDWAARETLPVERVP